MTPAPPWRIERFETLPSTSDTCAERARQGYPGRLLIIAASQTAGRGRAGRVWSSPPGNFYASALLRPNTPATQGGLFALIAGLSLLESLLTLTSPSPSWGGPGWGAKPTSLSHSDQLAVHPDPALTLKWPNDIMAVSAETGPAKLAGILLDATIESGRIATLIIGFGVNLTHAPAIPDRATTSATTLGLDITSETLAPRLTARLDHWLAAPPETLRATWLAHAHPIGAELAIDAGRLTGTFAGIDVDGSLLLRRNGHVIAIRSGDVALL